MADYINNASSRLLIAYELFQVGSNLSTRMAITNQRELAVGIVEPIHLDMLS